MLNDDHFDDSDFNDDKDDDDDNDSENNEDLGNEIAKKVKSSNRDYEKDNAIQEFKSVFLKTEAKPVSHLLNDSEFKKHFEVMFFTF